MKKYTFKVYPATMIMEMTGCLQYMCRRSRKVRPQMPIGCLNLRAR